MSAVQSKSNKKPWTGDEDAMLLSLVKEYGSCGSWPTIALHMEYRSGKQCRERYINQLDPLIKKSMWTYEEDATIIRMHSQYGKKWSKFMDHLPGRSDNAIKNRYHIISRDNYSDHNQHTNMKRALEQDSNIKVEEDNIPTVPESEEARLDRFLAVREALNREIDAMTLKRKAPRIVSKDGESPLNSVLDSLQLRKEEDDPVLDSLLLLKRGDSICRMSSMIEMELERKDPLLLLKAVADEAHHATQHSHGGLAPLDLGINLDRCPYMGGSRYQRQKNS